MKLSRHARIQKLRTVRQALEEVLNQSAVIPLGGPEQVMAQVQGTRKLGCYCHTLHSQQ